MPFAAAAIVVLALHAPPAKSPARLSQSEVESVVKATPMKLPRGATLAAVHVTALPPVPAAHTRIVVDVTPPAKKAGTVAAVAIATFYRDDEVVARVPLSLDLRVAREAAAFEVAKGSTVQLLVRKGLVEVTAPAVTSESADVGDTVQVLLRPSGRALRARLVARDRAVAVESTAQETAEESEP